LNLNGVRIEPAEVEAALRAEPGVIDTAVLAHVIPGDVVVDRYARGVGVAAERTVLVAFVASSRLAEPLTAALRARVTQALPAAARPGRFVILPALTWLSGGKVDLAALERMLRAGGV